MVLKYKLLEKLLKNNGPYSGQTLADEFSVSRNAVWKAFNSLKEDGYQIISHRKQGYELEKLTDRLDPSLINLLLKKDYQDLIIKVKEVTESTNDDAKNYMLALKESKICAIASKQKKGRGRRGRSFYSDLADGLYLSIGLKPKFSDPQDTALYTLMTALAVAKTIEDYAEKEPKIKWVNDIFLEGRKVAGILSELTLDMESEDPSNLIIGIGFNIAGDLKSLPSDLQGLVGTIYGQHPSKNYNPNSFAANFLNNFFDLEKDIQSREFLKLYRQYLLGLGEMISYKEGNQTFKAIMLGIDQDGGLLVEKANGQKTKLIGQEISLGSQQFTKYAEKPT